MNKLFVKPELATKDWNLALPNPLRANQEVEVLETLPNGYLRVKHDNNISVFDSNHFTDGSFYLKKSTINGFEKLDYNRTISEMVKKNNLKIVLMGHGGSGKDWAKKNFEKLGLIKEISDTTRPKREGEKEGIDYFFITEEEFNRKKERNQYCQHNRFGNGFQYGTDNEQFDSCNLFIMTPTALQMLSPEQKAKIFVIYFNISEEVRKDRLSKRSDSHDTERRLRDDKIDFENFNEWHLMVTNPEF
jgi:guanylate kinase